MGSHDMAGHGRAQELLAAGESALSRDQVAAARAAGDEARQVAEDCASIPLIRQVEALLLRVEAREESLLNREQGVQTCGGLRACWCAKIRALLRGFDGHV